MSVFKRGGSPFYQYDFTFMGRRFWGSTKLTNRKAAERYENKMREKLAQSRGGILDPAPPPFFADFASEFLQRTKAELRPRSWKRYQVSIKSLRPWFAPKRLDEILADDIERFKQARLQEGCSPSTVNRDLACLRRILSFALQLDLLVTTPFVRKKVRFLKERGRERILTFDEERRYLKAARNPLRDVATLMLEMGLRPEEVCSIRQENIHLGTRPPFLQVPGGKTKNARRDVVLTERARETLKHRLLETKGDYIFPLRVGRGFDWSHPLSELHPAHYQALAESEIQPPFQIYDLRHTYGTRAIESGTDPLTLMRLMGHQDLKTTMRYVHLSKAHLKEAQMRIERYRVRREREEKEEKDARRKDSQAVV
jgi:integrase